MKIVRRTQASPARETTNPGPSTFAVLIVSALVTLAFGCNTGKSAPNPANFTLAD